MVMWNNNPSDIELVDAKYRFRWETIRKYECKFSIKTGIIFAVLKYVWMGMFFHWALLQNKKSSPSLILI